MIVKIPKKGTSSECENWWAIGALTAVAKITDKTILESIKKHFEDLIYKSRLVSALNLPELTTSTPSGSFL